MFERDKLVCDSNEKLLLLKKYIFKFRYLKEMYHCSSLYKQNMLTRPITK